MTAPDFGEPGSWKYTDINDQPNRTPEMKERGQLWVWMSGPAGGHFEVRGTGLRLSPEDEARYLANKASRRKSEGS